MRSCRLISKMTALFILLSIPAYAQTPPAASEPVPPLIAAPIAQQTWDYLDANAPGEWSIVAYSLGGKPIREDALTAMTSALDNGLYSGFPSITTFETLMLSLIKTGQNPTDYQTRDLITLLGDDRFLYHEGLDGVSMALSIYNAAERFDVYIPETLVNCVPEVISHIGSCQQENGGFSVRSGEPPDVGASARAVMALSGYKNIPYAQDAAQKGIEWLSTQQNEDGTFSAQADAPGDCETTAAVLSAIRVCGINLDDPRFVKNGITLSKALSTFLNSDGGYSLLQGQTSSVETTEHAIIALYTDFFELFPYLPPFSYPGYVSPDQVPPVEEPTPQESSVWFIIKFLGILFLVYLLLQLTILIGKYSEKKKLPGSLAAEKEKQAQEEAERMQNATFEMHIPMNATLPDFDKLNETETRLATPPASKTNDEKEA